MLETKELIADNAVLKKDMHMLIKKINQYYSNYGINIFKYHKFHERDFIYINEKLYLNIKIRSKLAAIELNRYLEK